MSTSGQTSGVVVAGKLSMRVYKVMHDVASLSTRSLYHYESAPSIIGNDGKGNIIVVVGLTLVLSHHRRMPNAVKQLLRRHLLLCITYCAGISTIYR